MLGELNGLNRQEMRERRETQFVKATHDVFAAYYECVDIRDFS